MRLLSAARRAGSLLLMGLALMSFGGCGEPKPVEPAPQLADPKDATKSVHVGIGTSGKKAAEARVKAK